MRPFEFKIWNNVARQWETGPCEYLHIGQIFRLADDGEGDVVQFTGLFDKNGIKIFEGDVIKYDYPEVGDNIVIVRWSNEDEDNHPGFSISNLLNQGGPCEIVGNIYENPEFLSK